jgi:RNA processing factor Prp31
MQRVEGLPVEDVRLEIDHGQPDPHGREELDKRSRQLKTKSLRPPNSVMNAPTTMPSGA